LDDVIYQDSNVFSNLAPGFYTVYAKDKFGCGKTQQVIWILYYIRFFTPNGDGVNETWRIKNSQFEQDLTVVIFDRYGKVITSFDSDDQGWDGLYNGQQAISDDYWFLVSRQDGRTHRGHFA
jgi:gliding motility-associated-like protein